MESPMGANTDALFTVTHRPRSFPPLTPSPPSPPPPLPSLACVHPATPTVLRRADLRAATTVGVATPSTGTSTDRKSVV